MHMIKINKEKGEKGGLSGILALFILISLILAPSVAKAGDAKAGEKAVKGKKIGNCMACHFIPGVESPGNIGPNLVESMKTYFEKDREIVKQWVWDARKSNPDTIMPPFGANKVLTEQQIDDIVEYLYSLKKTR